MFGLSGSLKKNPHDRLPGSVGPISNSPRDIDLALDAIFNFQDMYKLDPLLENLPYKSLFKEKPKFKIATIEYSPYFNMTKPQARAYKLA